MSGIDIIYAILAGLLPSLIWLFFWTREDNHPEPRTLLAGCFLGGMLSVIVAILAEKYVNGLITDPTPLYIWWAAIEEVIKFTVVAIIALNSDWNDEPIDAMIYCITVALGFAAVENALFISGPLSGGQIAQSIVTGNMRFIGATLVHIVSSGLIGFSLGVAFYESKLFKFLAGICGLAGAIALHAAFNLSIINADSADTLKSFAWIWGAVVIMIVCFEEVKAIRPKLP